MYSWNGVFMEWLKWDQWIRSYRPRTSAVCFLTSLECFSKSLSSGPIALFLCPALPLHSNCGDVRGFVDSFCHSVISSNTFSVHYYCGLYFDRLLSFNLVQSRLFSSLLVCCRCFCSTCECWAKCRRTLWYRPMQLRRCSTRLKRSSRSTQTRCCQSCRSASRPGTTKITGADSPKIFRIKKQLFWK